MLPQRLASNSLAMSLSGTTRAIRVVECKKPKDLTARLTRWLFQIMTGNLSIIKRLSLTATNS